MSVVRSFGLWAVALVAVIAWVGLNSSPAPRDASRIAHLESLVRCPACADLSVAQSNATSALAVRHEIATRVHAGASDTQILTSLERTYGTSILLSPPTSGLGALLYAAPLSAAALVGVLAVRIARRR